MKQNRNHEYHSEKASRLKKLYEIIGYPLKDESIALQAITCSNFAKEYNDCSEDKIYEHDGLAVVGDAILKSVLSMDAFLADKTITEGDLTNQKKAIENNASLQSLGIQMNLPDILFYANTDLQGKKKIATAVEAIIGAIYFSHGFDACIDFIHRYVPKLSTSESSL